MNNGDDNNDMTSVDEFPLIVRYVGRGVVSVIFDAGDGPPLSKNRILRALSEIAQAIAENELPGPGLAIVERAGEKKKRRAASKLKSRLH